MTASPETEARPKRSLGEGEGRGALYPYYAGFSYHWALETVKNMHLPPARVVDPFNGAGTTTTAANACELNAIGLDLNPVAVTAALARLLPYSQLANLESVTAAIGRQRDEPPIGDSWLVPRAATEFGRIAQNLRRQAQHLPATNGNVRCLRAALDVVMFRSLRRLTRSFEGSNPTWVRRPQDHRQRLRPCREKILKVVQDELCQVIDIVRKDTANKDVNRASIWIGMREACPLPIKRSIL